MMSIQNGKIKLENQINCLIKFVQEKSTDKFDVIRASVNELAIYTVQHNDGKIVAMVYFLVMKSSSSVWLF